MVFLLGLDTLLSRFRPKEFSVRLILTAHYSLLEEIAPGEDIFSGFPSNENDDEEDSDFGSYLVTPKKQA